MECLVAGKIELMLAMITNKQPESFSAPEPVTSDWLPSIQLWGLRQR
jgi:hypothetical protein